MEFLLPIIIRLIAPFFIIIFPFWGSILGTIADTADVLIWNYLGVENLSSFYNSIDKALDSYMYLFMGYVAYKFRNKIVKKTALFLLFYRIFGSVIYELSGYRFLLFVFPNIFAIYFITYLGSKLYLNRDPITDSKRNLILLIVVTVPKLAQEYLFHVLEFNVFRYLLAFIT